MNAIKNTPGDFSVGGHTDSVGSDSYNQELSASRADAVRDHLVSQGIPPGRVKVRGFGESQPVATNDNDSGRAQYRRVEIELIK